MGLNLFKLLGTIAIENQGANSAIDETVDRASSGGSSMIDSFKKVGAAVATYLSVDAIISFGQSVVNAAASVAAETSAFSQIMGDYSDEAAEKVGKIADATGMVDSRLTPYMTSMTAKFSGLGYDIDEATNFASKGLTMAADASAFWDMSLDESMSHLNSFVNGSYEGGEAIGLFANDTQMAAYAIKTGLIEEKKEWAALDEATKQATRLEYAENMMKTSGVVGQAAKESEQYANVQANLTEKWRQFQAKIGEPFLQNIVIPAMSLLSDAVDKLSEKYDELTVWFDNAKEKVKGLSDNFEKLKTWVKENETAIQLVGIAVGTLTAAIVAYTAARAIQNAGGIVYLAQLAATAIGVGALTVAETAHTVATTVATAATTAFSAVLAFLTSPITLVIVAIGALIAIGVLLYKNWDTITEKCSEIASKLKEKWGKIKENISNAVDGAKEKVRNAFDSIKTKVTDSVSNAYNKVKDKFDSIKTKITDSMDNARKKVKEAIDKIKGFFNFKWELPKLKLPHFKINGKFSLNPPSVPKFSIDWYAKAMNNPMLLTEPTIFGYNAQTGQYLGGGEKGSEVVSGTNTLMNMISTAAQTGNDAIVYYLQKIVEILAEYFPEIMDAMDRPISFNPDRMAVALASPMDRELGRLRERKDRGR